MLRGQPLFPLFPHSLLALCLGDTHGLGDTPVSEGEGQRNKAVWQSEFRRSQDMKGSNSFYSHEKKHTIFKHFILKSSLEELPR